MKQQSGEITIVTKGRGLIEVSQELVDWVQSTGMSEGVLTVFIQHSSASLIIQENADPDVQLDLGTFYDRLVPDNPNLYRHTAEGADDMPAHIRSTLTDVSLTIPVFKGKLRLGIWQGVYVFEHRANPHHRQLALNIMGE